MQIEQYSPNKPNFGLVFALAGVALLVLLVLAVLFVRFDGNHLGLRHHPRHLTSQLVQPTPAPSYIEPSSRA